MSKQTAVEWLEMEIVKLENTYAIPHEIYVLCEQAKEIEKQQILLFAKEYDAYIFRGGNVTEEQYYNEQFKTK